MNYYERHLGDYARDTGHLSLLEHGVYTILLDRYYATEEGIPADQAHRLARARTEDERTAVDSVLSEFFTLDGNLWVSRRVEYELSEARERINRARENGKKGGRPPKTPKNTPNKTQTEPRANPDVTQPFPLGSEKITQTKAHQAPSIHLTEPKGSGADAPLPEIDPIWHTGLAFLIHKGVPEKHARSFLGKLKSAVGDFAAGALLAQAEADDITDPVPWLQANSRTQGASNANSTPRIRVGLADRHPRPTFDENGAITGQAVRIDR